MTRWNVPDVRRALKMAEGEGFDVTAVEFMPGGGFRLLTRRREPVGNRPGQDGPNADETPEDEVARKAAALDAPDTSRRV